jgi:SAM-dependent methyltransferase/methyltransferase-like protein
MPREANSYDSVLYPGLAFLQTHPDRLAVIATLLGMTPPSVEHCRVLEIACGNGSNLIPMAYGLPRSQFVGVDLAGRPVEAAQGMIQHLGLANIRIAQMDLMQIGADFGEFDYIIAHGVFAWVPKAVQEKILSICHANLSPDGVALVSYNTNPAGHVRQIVREMTQFHEQRSGGSANPVKTAREFLEAIEKAGEEPSPWKAMLQEELRLTFNRDERVVYHDDLAACFSPVSFSEFMARAAHFGLQFLSEVNLNEAMQREPGSSEHAALSQIARGDMIAYQQYLDYARYRRFRQTLLCHTGVRVRGDAILDRARSLLIASPMQSSAEQPDGAVEFTNSRGAGTLKTNNPLLVAALRRLEQIWPRAERFENLLNATLPMLPEALHSEAATSLAQAVLKLASNKLVDLRTYPWSLAEGVSSRPTASHLARIMAQEGSLITTLLHTHVELEDEEGRQFLQLLDGTRDRDSLTDAFAKDSVNVPRDTILKQIEGNLLNFHRLGLLVS